uniref:Uncharacterized protein n=1 Tax=Glossina pallidipes TaxID=7398 RepID=A0A1B0A4K2_GLOPL
MFPSPLSRKQLLHMNPTIAFLDKIMISAGKTAGATSHSGWCSLDSEAIDIIEADSTDDKYGDCFAFCYTVFSESTFLTTALLFITTGKRLYAFMPLSSPELAGYQQKQQQHFINNPRRALPASVVLLPVISTQKEHLEDHLDNYYSHRTFSVPYWQLFASIKFHFL